MSLFASWLIRWCYADTLVISWYCQLLIRFHWYWAFAIISIRRWFSHAIDTNSYMPLMPCWYYAITMVGCCWLPLMMPLILMLIHWATLLPQLIRYNNNAIGFTHITPFQRDTEYFRLPSFIYFILIIIITLHIVITIIIRLLILRIIIRHFRLIRRFIADFSFITNIMPFFFSLRLSLVDAVITRCHIADGLSIRHW